MTMSAKQASDVSYDSDLKLPVVLGKPHTPESLVAIVAKHCKACGITPYKIAKETKMTISAVKHFFTGYLGQGPAMQGTVRDPEAVGRCRLDTFLKIVQFLGLDIEIVAREKPGRGE